MYIKNIRQIPFYFKNSVVIGYWLQQILALYISLSEEQKKVVEKLIDLVIGEIYIDTTDVVPTIGRVTPTPTFSGMFH